jgi:hypothetical protein
MARRKHRFNGPNIFGLPGLPADMVDLIAHHGPLLILAIAVLSGFGAAINFMSISTTDALPPGSRLPILAGIELALAIAMGVAYAWLRQYRRLGWNMLATIFIVQFMSQVMFLGPGAIFSAGLSFVIIAYLMLQVRDSFSA